MTSETSKPISPRTTDETYCRPMPAGTPNNPNGVLHLAQTVTTMERNGTLPPNALEPPSHDFDGPVMNPVPLTDDASTPEATLGVGFVGEEYFWDFLNSTNPIDDDAMMALQVSNLTMGLAVLKARIEALERGDE